jgi:hypothetical protein
MGETFEQDIAAVSSIKAIPTILDIVYRTTGMRFAAVARVTEDRWIACSVRDDIKFGLKPGGELKVESKLCHEIRQSGEAVVIDHVAEDAVLRRPSHPAGLWLAELHFDAHPSHRWIVLWHFMRHRP